ncbi:MAG: class I SAM-dependent methyltransferase [Chloroflexota bacterium]|nr:class I SAM-dependent methyltransferase [Chloroflexota bacterium]
MGTTENPDPGTDIVAAALDKWLGHKHTGYDYVKIGKIMAAADAARFIQQSMPLAEIFPTRRQLHQAAIGARQSSGLVLEFGVAAAQSINFIADMLKTERIYGFDSFEGLPEDWTNLYRKGYFAAHGLPEVRDNVELVVGWFDKTLPSFLEQHPEDVSYLHVDCDLYASTKIIFDLLGHRIKPGTVIVFDEYFNYPTWRDHEHKAFSEFVAAHELKFHNLGGVSCDKQLAVVVDAIG